MGKEGFIMDARSVGLAFGVMVGLILCVVLFKFWNKDGKKISSRSAN